MIIKDLDPFSTDDKLGQAGRVAEGQMAFYLRRAFAADDEVLVLNGLRLERDGDAAQIDHLVLQPFGAVIVESKSVIGTVRVNSHGEWARVYGQQIRGMPSPLLQATRQADLLGDYLAGCPALGEKELAVFIRVAISDSGVIERPRNLELDEVYKADQVPDAIRHLIRGRTLLQHPSGIMQTALRMMVKAGLAVTGDRFSVEELAQLAAFLVAEHRPLIRSMPTQPVPPPAPPRFAVTAADERPPTCRHCGSTDLSVGFGYSYYFQCRTCGKKTAIRLVCPGCGGEERVQKRGEQFLRTCPLCKTTRPLFQHPMPNTAQ